MGLGAPGAPKSLNGTLFKQKNMNGWIGCSGPRFWTPRPKRKLNMCQPLPRDVVCSCGGPPVGRPVGGAEVAPGGSGK